jgi:hypothetical protein
MYESRTTQLFPPKLTPVTSLVTDATVATELLNGVAPETDARPARQLPP